MNVNIVTVYQSANYGSFLQAYSLYSIVGMKYPVYMVDAGIRNPIRNAVIPSIRRIFKSFIKFDLRYARFNCAILRDTYRKFKLINQVPLSKVDGVCIFGSDEIWNMERDEMRSYPVLWGEGIGACGKIAYAPSVNGCKEGMLQEGNFLDAIKTFNRLSVRDDYSREMLSKLAGMQVEKVLDPTMLLDRNHYIEVFTSKDKKVSNNYIAVYLFEVDVDTIKAVKAFARKTKKKLVSIGMWASWCDEVVTAINPFEYYIEADFVITNTFHGTAFAINLGKQFITFSRGKSKIRELLSDYGLSDRDASKMPSSDVFSIFDCEIDYSVVDKKLDENRRQSLRFLFDALARIEEENEKA